MGNWIPITAAFELDREKLAGILTRNGYEVRESRTKVKGRYEYYIEFRNRVENEELKGDKL